MSTAAEKANLARIRDNQRRSRARRKEYLTELEGRVRSCELQGVEASSEIQIAARNVADENRKLRTLLHQNGLGDDVIEGFLQNMRLDVDVNATSKVVQNLEAAMQPRKCDSNQACGGPVVENRDNVVIDSRPMWDGRSLTGTNPGLLYPPPPPPPPPIQNTQSLMSVQSSPNRMLRKASLDLDRASSVPRSSPNTLLQKQMNRLSTVSDSADFRNSRAPSTSTIEDPSFDSPVYSSIHQSSPYWQPSPLMHVPSPSIHVPYPYSNHDMSQYQFHQRPDEPPSLNLNHVYDPGRSAMFDPNPGVMNAGMNIGDGGFTTSSCAVATDLITSMTGSDPNVIKRELGCGSRSDCQVDNQLVFNVMDRCQGVSPQV